MKSHSKVGGKPGQPAYRTPSTFKVRQDLKVQGNRSAVVNKKQRAGGQKRFGR